MKNINYKKSLVMLLIVIILIILGAVAYSYRKENNNKERFLGKVINYVDKCAANPVGNIIFYNNFSTSTERIISYTKLESGDGQIYRTSKSVEIPGFTFSGVTKIVGKSKPISICIDGGIKLGNIKDGETFKITGFKDRPEYDLFYGKAYLGAITNDTKYESYNSSFGFSFQYPNSLYVTTTVNPDRIMLLPTFRKDDKDKPMSAVVITVSENNQETPLEWISGKNSTYDISNGYEELTIDGQGAVAVGDKTWVVVNTPDKKKKLSISLLTQGGAEPLYDEQAIVVNSLKFSH